MSQSRSYNAKRNAISGIINKIISLIIPFIVRTVLIYKLGTEYLGLTTLFTSILQVLNMAELGFSSAITFSLYKPLAENDEETVCAYLTYFRRVYKMIGIIVIGAGMLLLPFITYLVKGDYPSDINIYVIFVIYILNTSFSYIFWGYKSVLLTALQKLNIINNVATILNLTMSILQLVVLFLFSNFYLYVLCILLITIITNIVIKSISDRLYPAYTGTGKLLTKQRKMISKQIRGLAIGKISNTARNSFDSIVLSMFFGLSDLAIYSNYYYVITAVLGVITVLTNAVAAGIGDSVATETFEKNYNDFKKIYFLFEWLGTWCTITMLCLYQQFMELWMGHSLIVSESTMFLFVTYFYILQNGQIRAVYTRAIGLWWEARYLTIGEGIANLSLNFILGYFFGMNGILFATIITVTIFSIIGYGKMTMNRCFKKSAKEFFNITGIYVVITIILSVGMYSLMRMINVHGLIGLVINAGVCFLVLNSIILSLSMTNKNTKVYIYDIKNRFI